MIQIEEKRSSALLLRRLVHPSGRAYLEAWEPWPEDVGLAKDRVGLVDTSTDPWGWWQSLPLRRAHAVIQQAFPDAVVGPWSDRQRAFREETP